MLFRWGKNQTNRYGDIEFDRLDAEEVMRQYRWRGVFLPTLPEAPESGSGVPWDAEHANALNGPDELKRSHGWSALAIEDEGLVAYQAYTDRGKRALMSGDFVYDSPQIGRWRGNHVRFVEMLSLVTVPARNHSTPLLMTGQDNATAHPLRTLVSSTGNLIAAAQDAEKIDNPELKAAAQKVQGALNPLLSELQAALQKADPEGKLTAAQSETAQMSGAAHQAMAEEATFAREIVREMGVKTIPEARARRRAERENLALLSGQQAANIAAKDDEIVKLSVEAAVKEGRVTQDRHDKLCAEFKGKPDECKAYLSGLIPRSQVQQPTAPAGDSEGSTLMSGAETDPQTKQQTLDTINRALSKSGAYAGTPPKVQ